MPPELAARPGRNLRPRAGGDQSRDLDQALAHRQRHDLRPDRRHLFAQPGEHRSRAAEFRVGNLYINRKITGALVDRQPFGGFKLSGIGSKAGGTDYLPQFLVPRTITENTMRRGFVAEGGGTGS